VRRLGGELGNGVSSHGARGIVDSFSILAFSLLASFFSYLPSMARFAWLTRPPARLSAVEHNHYYRQFSTAVSVYIPYQAYVRRINFPSGLVLVVFFVVTVKIFPGIKIRKRHQLVGALIFCVLWQLARTGFGMYVKHVARVSIVYCSLSSIVLILMWVFYSSAVLLGGVHVRHARAPVEAGPRIPGAFTQRQSRGHDRDLVSQRPVADTDVRRDRGLNPIPVGGGSR